MLKFRHFLLLCIVSFSLSAAQISQKQEKVLQFIYNNALHDFQVGSYYQALDEFNYLTKHNSPYLLPSLYMMAYTYLYIGKRIGDKKYLWDALNYLNLYFVRGGTKDAKYYFLKGLIYENLGFYDRAFTNYKLALQNAHDKHFRLDILMGLLRSSVWLHHIDQADRYLLILSIESLQEKQKKEFVFLQGMYYFAKKEYKKAFSFFKRTYKEFESYLIANPTYYLLVAETAYRKGDLQFSQMLFRRILNYIKNKNVLPHALLRSGDIAFLQRAYKESVNYYIRIIKMFPNSKYATIAKLKLLYIISKDKKIAYYIKHYLNDAPFLRDPLVFITKTLIKNRGNYRGIFALANFGYETFLLNSDKLYKRLGWELSLIDPHALKYEHIEYFNLLWDPYLLKENKHICQLYRANEKFFQVVFTKNVLMHIADALERCNKRKKSIELLEYLEKKYRSDDIYIKLAQRFFVQKAYRKALAYEEKIRHKDCHVYRLRATICYVGNLTCKNAYTDVLRHCPHDFYRALFQNILYLRQGKIDKIFFKRYKKELIAHYNEPVTKKFISQLVQQLLAGERYDQVVSLLGPLASATPHDCFLHSVLALSYVRLHKIAFAKKILENVGKCNNSWYNLAMIALQDAQLQQQLKGEDVGQDR